jgi:hypothetical protein
MTLYKYSSLVWPYVTLFELYNIVYSIMMQTYHDFAKMYYEESNLNNGTLFAVNFIYIFSRWKLWLLPKRIAVPEPVQGAAAA